MGAFTIQIVGDGSVGTKTKTYVVSDADINRLMAFATVIAIGNGIPSPTVIQAALALADAVTQRLRDQLRNFEINQVAILPITMT